MALDLLSALIRQTHKQIRSIIINNKTESNSEIMAEAFNNFFVTIASDIYVVRSSALIPITTKIISKALHLAHFS